MLFEWMIRFYQGLINKENENGNKKDEGFYC